MVKMGVIICLMFLSLVLTIGVCTNIAFAESTETAFQMDMSEFNYTDTPINKLGRGLVNTATCWAEIPGEVAKVSNETDPSIGFTIGVAQGVLNTIVRAAVGIFDTVTCIVPPYNKPELKPEYALQSADQNLRDYLW